MFNKYMQKVFDNQIKRHFFTYGAEPLRRQYCISAAFVRENIANKKYEKVWNYTFFIYLCTRKTARGVAQPG